jgi:hypothetical protein
VLPGNLGEALCEFSRDKWLRESLGEAFCNKYVELKTKEWREFNSTVHEWERKRLWTLWDRIDVIASDHAPHTIEEKNVLFRHAPSGIPGVETMIPLLFNEYLKGRINLLSIIEKTSWIPADILGIPRAGFLPGERADFTLLGDKPIPISADDLNSRAGWTPFEGFPAIFPEVVIMVGGVVSGGVVPGGAVPPVELWPPPPPQKKVKGNANRRIISIIVRRLVT